MGLRSQEEDRERVCGGPREITSGLTDHWRMVFAPRACEGVLADRLIADFGFTMASDCPPPMYDEVRRYILAQGGSAAGLDGLPYEAWANRPRGPDHLYELLQWPLPGLSVSADFNDSFGVFIPKGDGLGGAEACARAPDATRPLAAKCTDSIGGRASPLGDARLLSGLPRCSGASPQGESPGCTYWSSMRGPARRRCVLRELGLRESVRVGGAGLDCALPPAFGLTERVPAPHGAGIVAG